MSKKTKTTTTFFELFRQTESDTKADSAKITPNGEPEVTPTNRDNMTLSLGGFMYGNHKDYKKGAKRDRK